MTPTDGDRWPAPPGPYYTPPPPRPAARPITVGSVIARSLLVGIVSFVAALMVGVAAALLTGLFLASDGDPGYLEVVGTLLWAAIVFFLASWTTYTAVVVLGVRWFLPVGRRLVPGLVLAVSPPFALALIGVLAQSG